VGWAAINLFAVVAVNLVSRVQRVEREAQRRREAERALSNHGPRANPSMDEN